MLLPAEILAALGPMDQGRVVTDDGTQLLYQRFGAGPPVVLANGIGVRYPGLVRQIEALREAHQVICWDYRGMGQSVLGHPLGDVTMPRHARDALAVLDHLGLSQAVFVGWSMGVQVALEVARLAPERMTGLVALLGSYGIPFRTAFPEPVALIAERALAFLGKYPELSQKLLDLAVALPGAAFRLLSTVTFVSAQADPAVFAADVRCVAGADKRTYMRTLLSLADHDASDVLSGVTCPTLVICGTRDTVTPPRVAKYMAERIAGADYREVEGGSHFALIEQPELVNRWLVEFARTIYPATQGQLGDLPVPLVAAAQSSDEDEPVARRM
ncbi:MAG: alpha/beta hydrolase [Deltaproteobacteria bacterium]|nr:alpha/beta hydrolase [Deltaproteobacteria bacterium]